MKNYENEGEVQTFTPPGAGVVTGLGYQIGQAFGIATKTVTSAEVTAGALCELLVRGIVAIVKVGTQAWTEGALVYWDDGNHRATTSAAGNRLIGWAVPPAIGAGASETTGHVYLDGVARDNEST